jgi:hypothetical protein
VLVSNDASFDLTKPGKWCDEDFSLEVSFQDEKCQAGWKKLL